MKLMSSSDQKTFNFDPKTINWKTYMPDYYFGIKNYIMKDIPKDPALLTAKITKYECLILSILQMVYNLLFKF